MPWTAIGSTLAGSAATSAFGHYQAGRQMDFQREMSGTAYQRAMRDMRKAGLNPILAYQQGGASTPAGAAASAPDMGANITASHTAKLQRDNLKEQNENLKEQNLNLSVERDRIRENTAKMEAEKQRIREQTRRDRQIGNMFDTAGDLSGWIPGMGQRNPGWYNRIDEAIPDFLKFSPLFYGLNRRLDYQQRSSESTARDADRDEEGTSWWRNQLQRFIDWGHSRGRR